MESTCDISFGESVIKDGTVHETTLHNTEEEQTEIIHSMHDLHIGRPDGNQRDGGNNAFPQPRTYGDMVSEAPPAVFSRGWTNQHNKRKTNYGIEFTITGNDLTVLNFQGYKVIDSLLDELGIEHSKSVKKHFDSVITEMKGNEARLRQKGWVPIRPDTQADKPAPLLYDDEKFKKQYSGV